VSNSSGQATAFMALTPIQPGEEAALRSFLGALRQDESPLARLGGTHFARWVILDDWVNDPSQPREDHLQSRYLIFTSNFDGPLDPYLDELCVKLAAEAFTGPEYVEFGTNLARPLGLNEDSFHGPSTTCHSGLVA